MVAMVDRGSSLHPHDAKPGAWRSLRLVGFAFGLWLMGCGPSLGHDDEEDGGEASETDADDGATPPAGGVPGLPRDPEACADDPRAPSPGGNAVAWLTAPSDALVVKLDVASGQELARYLAPSDTNPIHVSVDATGTALVSDPEGLVMIVGEGACEERNGRPEIQTSDGAPLPFGEDDCLAIVEPSGLAEVSAAHWVDLCGADERHAWVVGAGVNEEPTALLVTLPSGATAAEVSLADALSGWGQSLDGVVDRDGNLWVVTGQGDLARVGIGDLSVRAWTPPDPVGDVGLHGGFVDIAVAGDGAVIVCAQEVVRFEPTSELWSAGVHPGLDVTTIHGCALDDAAGRLWQTHAYADVLTAIEIPSFTAVLTIGFESPGGVAVDAEGHVWVVDEHDVVRVDGETGELLLRYDFEAAGIRNIAVRGDFIGVSTMAAGAQTPAG